MPLLFRRRREQRCRVENLAEKSPAGRADRPVYLYLNALAGIIELRDAGHLYQKDGAWWFRSTDFGDEKDRVVIRDNGQATYFAW